MTGEPIYHTTNHREFVGPKDKYDIIGAQQLHVLVESGMREHHSLLDLGCGSLRGGRFAMMYLNPGRYVGIEPARWLIDEAIENEVSNGLMELKKPRFYYDIVNYHRDLAGQKFDYLIAQSIFSHCNKTLFEQHVWKMRNMMHGKSVMLGTVFLGSEDSYSEEQWVYPGSTAFTWDTIYVIFDKYGLELDMLVQNHPMDQTWFTARTKI